MGAALMPMQAAQPTILAPYRYLVLDIETAGGRPEDAERWMRLQWSPNPSWKPETIGERYLKLLASKKEKLALLDASQIVCISLRSETETRCLHSCYKHPLLLLHGAGVEGFGSEADMLAAFRDLLETRCSTETVIAGHNILSFDLRRLRNAFVRDGVRLPAALLSRDQAIFDTMRAFCDRYSANTEIMIGLADTLEAFGLESHKNLVSGAMVPELYASGQFDTLISYAILDVIAEAELYERMTGQAVGLR